MVTFLALVTLANLVDLSSQRPGVLDEIFTQNIVPKAVHSHNNYWCEVVLLTALSYGVASVEADMWFVGRTLYIGHEMAALAPARTFDSLQNPKSRFTVNQTSIDGVFDTTSTTPLQLFVDMKTDGSSTLPFVISALQPLRELGTCVSNVTCTIRVITVVRTVGWSGINAINDTALTTIQTYVADAHTLGIRARFWDTRGWPMFARENIWKTLTENGADFLNADDLEAAATMF
ncbi:hypothetical protein DFH07DRAFT_864779 [Mycena maculata]|uniref:Altered inheritance of mitochondria protein 6 n=1 Tax=Mycena maculata TaxID=230809 RepID=A0AAD7KIN1_9AGAR|nr:hypothetical protein DFH07DRAFT_864779 [Mycena maculata]